MLPRLFHLIGSDRYLTPMEVEQASQPHPLTAGAWEVYSNQFHGFTGATLDPLFHRLAHPSRQQGSVRLDAGTSALIVGTGPSLRPNLAEIKKLAGRVRIFTSPRGAEVLLPNGIVPDVVLIEHHTALDAHHSARHLGDCTNPVLSSCPLVAADSRTPAALVAAIPAASLFIPTQLPTWGLWPATAAAMAIEAGASRVALVGVDLGTATQPDPAHAPLAALLALIARLSPVVALDCGAGGATKRGWLKAALAEAAGARVRGTCELNGHPAPRQEDRLARARGDLRELAPIVERASALLAAATDARARVARPQSSMLEAGSAEMMAWRDDARIRVLVQECLGVAFLPRLWRIGIDPALGAALWRPVMLATHELVEQAQALARLTAMAEAA
jgi:hypothetical protein